MSLSQQTLVVLILRGMRLDQTPAFASLLRADEALAVQCFDNGQVQWSELTSHWRMVSDGANPGVGPRYLEAAHIAKECGFPFLLLLDQDFQAPEGWWAAYWEAVKNHPSASAWAPTLDGPGRQLSPFCLDGARPGDAPTTDSLLSLKRHVALNSGLLVRTDPVLTADASLRICPLDFSDFALCHAMGLRDGWLAPVSLRLEHSSSTHLESSQASRLARFRWFAYGAKGWSRLRPEHRLSIAHWVLGRGLQLAFQYRSMGFLACVWRNFLRGDPPGSNT